MSSDQGQAHAWHIHLAVVAGASAGAGLSSLLAFYPIDVVMSRLQLQGGAINEATRSVWRDRGVKGFYTGMSRWVVGACVQRLAFMGSYEMSRRWLDQHHPGGGWQNKLLAGMSSAVVDSLVATNPDLNKVFRMQGIAIRGLPWLGHWRAFMAMFYKNAPANASLLIGRDYLADCFAERGYNPSSGAATAGLAFGVASQLFVAPLDTIKTRLYGGIATAHSQHTALPRYGATAVATLRSGNLFAWRIIVLRMAMKGGGTALGFFVLAELMRLGFQHFEPHQHPEYEKPIAATSFFTWPTMDSAEIVLGMPRPWPPETPPQPTPQPR